MSKGQRHTSKIDRDKLCTAVQHRFLNPVSKKAHLTAGFEFPTPTTIRSRSHQPWQGGYRGNSIPIDFSIHQSLISVNRFQIAVVKPNMSFRRPRALRYGDVTIDNRIQSHHLRGR
jgi:hypothetical protein